MHSLHVRIGESRYGSRVILPLLCPLCCCCRLGVDRRPRRATHWSWRGIWMRLITFDPAQIGEVNGNDIIVGNVCSTLVQYDPKDVTKIIPGTAESWSSSPDGLTLTFKLRSDLKFPDGTPATAEDAAWSLQRAVLLGFFSSANLTAMGLQQGPDRRPDPGHRRHDAGSQAVEALPRSAAVVGCVRQQQRRHDSQQGRRAEEREDRGWQVRSRQCLLQDGDRFASARTTSRAGTPTTW